MVTIWVETRTRVPERPGEYRVLQRGAGRKLKELTAYWNGRCWTQRGELLPEIAEKVPQKKLTEEEALAKRQAQRHRYYEHKKAMARGEKEFLTKTCALCGKEFTMPYGIGRARRYCSPECQDLALKIKQKNYNLKRRQTDGQGQEAGD